MNDHMTELLRYSVAQDTESQEERDTEAISCSIPAAKLPII